MTRLDATREDRLKEWEQLINDVDKSDIPLRFVGSIKIVFREPVNGSNKTNISVHQMRMNDMSDEEIEERVEDFLAMHKENIKTVNFYVDVELVATIVEHHTDTLLKGTK